MKALRPGQYVITTSKAPKSARFKRPQLFIGKTVSDGVYDHLIQSERGNVRGYKREELKVVKKSKKGS